MKFPKKIGQVKKTRIDDDGLHVTVKLNKKLIKRIRKIRDYIFLSDHE